MQGRKVVPIEEKVKRGTYRPGRDPTRKATVPPVEPKAAFRPSSPLSDEEREAFDAIVEDMRLSRTLSPIYRRAMTQLAILEVRAAAMRKAINGKFVLKGKSKDNDRNPALSQLKSVEIQIYKYLSSLGLTPDTAARVPKAGGGADAPVEEEDNEFAEFG